MVEIASMSVDHVFILFLFFVCFMLLLFHVNHVSTYCTAFIWLFPSYVAEEEAIILPSATSEGEEREREFSQT